MQVRPGLPKAILLGNFRRLSVVYMSGQTNRVKKLNVNLKDASSAVAYKFGMYCVFASICHTRRCSRHIGVGVRRLGTGKSCKR